MFQVQKVNTKFNKILSTNLTLHIMTESITPEQRSYNMSQIRSSNTKPEIKLRKRIFAEGLRYRINDRKLSGKPDLVLKKYNTVILLMVLFCMDMKNSNIL